MAKRKKRPAAPASAPATPAEKPVLAPMRIRLAAVVYDALLIIALNAIVGAILVGIATPKEIASQHRATALPADFRHFVLFPAMVLTTWLFYGYFWRKAGQTLGMQTWRIRVLRPDGGYLRWSESFGRCAAAMILPACCGLIGKALYGTDSAFLASVATGFFANYGWSLIGRRGLAWHDQLSGTVVIRLPKEQHPKRKFFGWFSDRD